MGNSQEIPLESEPEISPIKMQPQDLWDNMKTPQPVIPKQPEEYQRELDIANETIEALQDQLRSEMLKNLTLKSKVDRLGLHHHHPPVSSSVQTPREAENFTPVDSIIGDSRSDSSWVGK